MNVCIVGPTASGKTDLAIAVARVIDAEIISVDSMQVYRGMDIGTAKPSIEQQDTMPHHLIDLVDPDCQYDAGRFVLDAERAMEALRSRKKQTLLVGGTGLYLRGLLWGLVDLPRDTEIRHTLREREAADAGSGYRQLCDVDPQSATRIAAADWVRIERALEVYLLTGKTMSAHHALHEQQRPRHEAIMFHVFRPIEELEERIAARTRTMWRSGLVEETKRLMADGFADTRPLKGIGYKQARQFIDGEIDVETAIAQQIKATRAYAKRQRTWFQKERGVITVDLARHEDPLETLLARLDESGWAR